MRGKGGARGARRWCVVLRQWRGIKAISVGERSSERRNGKHGTRGTIDGTAGPVRRQTVGRGQKHAKREKVGGRCLALTWPGARVYICESEAVRDKYSMHKVSWRGGE